MQVPNPMTKVVPFGAFQSLGEINSHKMEDLAIFQSSICLIMRGIFNNMENTFKIIFNNLQWLCYSAFWDAN